MRIPSPQHKPILLAGESWGLALHIVPTRPSQICTLLCLSTSSWLQIAVAPRNLEEHKEGFYNSDKKETCLQRQEMVLQYCDLFDM